MTSKTTSNKMSREDAVQAYALEVARECKFKYAIVSKFETRCMIAAMMDRDGLWISNAVSRSRMNAEIQSAARAHCR